MNNELVISNQQITPYKKDLDKIIKDNYYPNAKTVYDIIKKQKPDITLKQVNAYLQTLEPYQLTHERKLKKSDMGFMVANYPFQIVQIDLLDLSKFSYDYSQYKVKKKMDNVHTDNNKGYKYLLLFIDIFTRFADAVMLKTKNIEECTNALNIIIEFNKIKPQVIMSDSESSFLSKPFQSFLSEHNIKHDVVVLNNHRALSVIDRLCRTIRARLTKVFLGTGSTSWVNDISNIIYQYNNTPHKGLLKFSPQEVLTNKQAQEIILELNNEKASKNQELRNKATIEPGDKVRLYIENKFKKGSEPSFSNKTYIVVSRSGKNILLDNGKRYVDQSLLKIAHHQYMDNDLLLENDAGKDENQIQEANKQNKINRKIKQAGLERSTYEELLEPRATRKKVVDYKKLNNGK